MAAVFILLCLNTGLAQEQDQKTSVCLTLPGPIHLGDETFPGWSQLYGNCLEFEITITLPVERLTMMVQTFGLEINAPVYLNYSKVAVLPRQAVNYNNFTKPNEWTEDRIIALPTGNLQSGLNRITILTGLVPRPELSGDLDDFQIRNLRIILN
jgi:hypothetical protein